MSKGDFIHLAKKGKGDFILVVKNMGGDYIHLYKNDKGGFYPGGILSVSHASYPAMKY